MARRDSHHLQLRGRTLYAVLDVPLALRQAVGRKRLVQSLQTESMPLAKRRRDIVIGEWQKHLSAVRNGRAEAVKLPT
jgi:hypothetical protein